jgi:hypothetical protein
MFRIWFKYVPVNPEDLDPKYLYKEWHVAWMLRRNSNWFCKVLVVTRRKFWANMHIVCYYCVC